MLYFLKIIYTLRNSIIQLLSVFNAPTFSNYQFSQAHIERPLYAMKLVRRCYKDINEKTIDWLWEPYLGRGKVALVQGDPGDGKSSIVFSIAANLTNGELPPANRGGELVWPDKTAPCDIVVWTTENNAEDVAKPRLRKNHCDFNHFYDIDCQKTHPYITREDLEESVAGLNVHLMIIDPLQEFIPSDASLYSSKLVRKTLTVLSEFAEDNNIAIICVGHINKNEGAKSVYRGLGSIDITAAFRSVLEVFSTKVPSIRGIRSIKSNYDQFERNPIFAKLDDSGRIQFISEDEYLEIAEDISEDFSVSHTTKIDHAQQYLQEILSNGPVESNELKKLCADAGISQSTRNRAKALINVKSFWRDGHSYWRLP